MIRNRRWRHYWSIDLYYPVCSIFARYDLSEIAARLRPIHTWLWLKIIISSYHCVPYVIVTYISVQVRCVSSQKVFKDGDILHAIRNSNENNNIIENVWTPTRICCRFIRHNQFSMCFVCVIVPLELSSLLSLFNQLSQNSLYSSICIGFFIMLSCELVSFENVAVYCFSVNHL